MTLFTRVGRNLELTETGRLVLSYADEIFSLGDELREVIHQLPDGRPQLFRVGVVDVVSKSITHRILKPALQMPVRMICREASFIRCWRNWPCTVLIWCWPIVPSLPWSARGVSVASLESERSATVPLNNWESS